MRSFPSILALFLLACGSDSSGPSAPSLAVGTTRYTAVREGTTDTLLFAGTAFFDPRGLPYDVDIELAADAPGFPSYHMHLYRFGPPTLTRRTYRLSGDEAHTVPDSVFYIHGSHTIWGDAGTTGTFTIAKVDSTHLVADFQYRGPADSAGIIRFVDIAGKLSAVCPDYWCP